MLNDKCNGCGHMKSIHYEQSPVGAGCASVGVGGFPCKCDGFSICPSCAAKDAEIARLREALRHIVQWSDAVWTSGYGGEVHPAWLDVQEGRKLLE